MTRLLALWRKEWIQIRRNPLFLVIFLMTVTVQMILFGHASSSRPRNLPLLYCDQDRTEASRRLLLSLRSGNYFDIVGRVSTEEEVVRALTKGRGIVGVVIPENFSEKLLSEKRGSLTVYLDGTHTAAAILAKGYLFRSVLHFFKERTVKEEDLPRVEPRYLIPHNPALKDSLWALPGLVAAAIGLILTVQAASAFAREKESGTLAGIRMSPVRPVEFLLGKGAVLFCVAAVHTVLGYLTAALWFQVPFLGRWDLFAAASVFFIVSSIAVGFLAASVSNSQYQAIVSSLMVAAPLLFLSGAMSPVHYWPPFFKVLAWANPLYHYVAISRGTLVMGYGWREGWPWFSALFLMTAVLLSLSLRQAKRFFAGS